MALLFCVIWIVWCSTQQLHHFYDILLYQVNSFEDSALLQLKFATATARSENCVNSAVQFQGDK